MNRTIRTAAALVLCSTLALVANGGCAKRNDKLPDSRSRHPRHPADESSFAAGTGRAPTAATSYSFAKILVSQGRDRDALYVLTHVVREHPKFLPAYNEIAGIYMRADRLDDAIAALTTALELAPKDGVLHNNVGMCYLLKEEPEKALESFTHATEAVPNSATFRANRATALALTAREADAESEYRTIVGTLQARENVNILTRARQPQKPQPQPQSQPEPETKAPQIEATPTVAPAEEIAPSNPAPAAAETEADEETPSQISASFNVLRDLEISERSDYYATPVKLDVMDDYEDDAAGD